MRKSKIGCVIAYTKGHNNYGTSLQGYAMLKKNPAVGIRGRSDKIHQEAFDMAKDKVCGECTSRWRMEEHPA